MGYIFKFTIFVTLAAVGLGIFKISSLFEVPPVPKLEETWWGTGVPGKEDKSIKPFLINVPDEVLKDLRYRLTHMKPLSPPLEGTLHSYGINSKLTTKIVEFWANNYNWREREKLLNQYPQFKTNIQGLNIHYLHVKPKEAKNVRVLPLLLLHGWPGSVKEFYKIIPLLTTPQKGRDFVFEVIVPSLPGYSFSDAAVKPGFGVAEMSLVLKNLMLRLNLDKFYVQGGDWGAAITTYMSILFPKNIVGMHSNMCGDLSPISSLKRLVYSLRPSLIVDKKYEHLVYPMSSFISRILEEFGYLHLQATKPDTVGIALTDSPAGLAAYILEKFIDWTEPIGRELEDGGLTRKYTMEDLLDNIMIYWVTGSITTSMRLYSEFFNKRNLASDIQRIPVSVPAGCSRFIHDIIYSPSALLEDKYPKLLHVTDHEGGHFAAFEVPEILAKDIYDFIEKTLKVNNV